jgi:hypothetical protein
VREVGQQRSKNGGTLPHEGPYWKAHTVCMPHTAG